MESIALLNLQDHESLTFFELIFQLFPFQHSIGHTYVVLVLIKKQKKSN